MPINKAARFRFEIIDECLRNTSKKWSKAELLKFINRRLALHFGEDTSISASQLRYDLENMQTECSAPIEMYKSGRSFYYRYEDPEFSIKTIPIAEEDIIKLNDAVNLLQQIKGFTIADELAEIVKRIENRYKLTNIPGSTIISFESSPAVQGIENLEDIYLAIIRKKVLKIVYKAFHAANPRVWHIHPYMLKEYGHRWYLFGYVHEKENPGVFSLDRMKELRVSKLAYRENDFINCEDYFQDVIGVTVVPNQVAEEIELLFSAKFSPYIATKPLHASQQIIKNYEDGNLHVHYKLIINPELISILLGYGSEVKVLKPQKLVAEIKRVAGDIMIQYE